MTVPSPTTFLLATPLYSHVEYVGAEVWEVLDVLYYAGTYDSFCTKCNRESTFQMFVRDRPSEHIRNVALERKRKDFGITIQPPTIEPGIYHLQASCTRMGEHIQNFIALAENQVVSGEKGVRLRTTIQKIGQHPSYGDLHLAQVKKYAHVLDQAQLGELTRAIGLASHDVGVGAYVYLRRIFEGLVEDAHQIALKEDGWDDAQYERSRMAEKIGLLKEHLPPFLVEHPAMYSLLSKGIHELSEQDCLRNFETLRIGIELILDERLEQRQKAQKVAAARTAIQKAIGDAKA